MIVKQLSVTNLSDDERTTFVISSGKMVPEALQPAMANRVNKMYEGNQQFLLALNRDKSNEFTGLVAEKDAKREDDFRALKYKIKSSVYDRDPDISAAANVLEEILVRNNSTVYRLNYQEQTTYLKSLKLDLEKENENLEKADCTRQFQNLCEGMEEFDVVYSMKAAADSQQDNPGLVESRANLNKQINDFLNAVKIAVEDEEPGIELLVPQVNALITSLNAKARARQTRKRNGEKDQDNPVSSTADSQDQEL